MRTLSQNPAAVYRKVDLDARIEASQSADLTQICLEEAIATLGQALFAIERSPQRAPRESLARAHAIALWLTQSVDPENPMRDNLLQFYGGQAALIRRNLVSPQQVDITRARDDFADILAAARAAGP